MNREVVIERASIPGIQSYDLAANIEKVKKLTLDGNQIKFSYDKYTHKLYIFQVPMRAGMLKALVIENIYGSPLPKSGV